MLTILFEYKSVELGSIKQEVVGSCPRTGDGKGGSRWPDGLCLKPPLTGTVRLTVCDCCPWVLISQP